MIRAKITIVNKKDYRKYIKEVTFTYEGPANKLRRIFLWVKIETAPELLSDSSASTRPYRAPHGNSIHRFF